MTSIRTAPCQWPLDLSCCPDWIDPDTTDAQRARATALATEYLWHATGMRYGTCPIVVRPCRVDRCGGCDGSGSWWAWGFAGLPVGGGPFSPWLDGGLFRNNGCGCEGPCCCDAACQQWLPGPVESITQVKVDGAVLTASEYRVDDYDTLTRLGAAGECWPNCQPMELPDTAEGTWSVSYQRGIPVPLGGQSAAGLLACEFLRACVGDKRCRLPVRTQTITRQGLTIELNDAQDLVKDGLTGVFEVDAWIKGVNPYGLWEPSSVWSPDLPRTWRRQTWP